MTSHSTSTNAIPRILLAEDEPSLAEGIQENLEAEGYTVDVAADGAQAISKALASPYDLIVLDVMMPQVDGLQVCENIRQAGLQTPVMFLTVKGSTEDRIKGLEAGGDDYLAKPFHLQELLLRVNAILRRSRWYRDHSSTLVFGDNSVEFETYRAINWRGETQSLSHKEALILKLLDENEGQVVSRERILDRVWGYDTFPTTRTIDNFIVRLRKRFEREPDHPRHFHTVRGTGYRFTRDPQALRDGATNNTAQAAPTK
jgi:two-component system, OmpR family, alkaline phosphatase synthesis response regulator PhoP